MLNLVYLCSQYELLKLLAQNLTAIDLYHTALACRDLQGSILERRHQFNTLKSLCLCDGSGLKIRQAEAQRADIAQIRSREGGRPLTPYVKREDTSILKDVKCDAANGSPCIKCGIIVCQECRDIPRVGNNEYGPCRRPHLTTTYQLWNIICYCHVCDESIEKNVDSTFCECDRYSRWICHACHKDEAKEVGQYFDDHTEHWGGGKEEDEIDFGGIGMVLSDHQHDRKFWCACGHRSPADGNIRCSWCKHRHKTYTDVDHYGVKRTDLDWDDEDGFTHPFQNVSFRQFEED